METGLNYLDLLELRKNHFVNNNIGLGDLIATLPQVPIGWQQELLIDIVEGLSSIENQGVIRIAIKGAYGIGKTTFLSILAMAHLFYFGFQKKTKSSYKGTIVSGTRIQLKTVLQTEIKRLLSASLFKDYIDVNNDALYLKNDPNTFIRFCVCNSDNSDSFAGVHADEVITIFDEGTAICADAYKLAETFNSSGRCLWVVAGNPTYVGGEFFKLFMKESWRKKTVKRFDFFGHDDRFSIDVANDYGIDSDTYLVQVLGEFPINASSTVFSQFTIDNCIKRGKAIKNDIIDSYKCGKVVIGVDVAKGQGLCDHAIVVRDAIAVRKIIVSQDSLIELPGLIAEVAIGYDTVAIMIDAIGCGSGVDSYVLLELSRRTGRTRGLIKVIPIISSESPKFNHSCINVRAELTMEAKKWCEAYGAFSPSEHMKRFKEELQDVVFDSGIEKVKIAKKNSVRDIADAFIYTFGYNLSNNNKFC